MAVETLRYCYRSPLAAIICFLLLTGSVDAATLTVTSAADTGGTCFPGAPCTLRQAIATASPGDMINFAAGITTISLTAQLLITNSLTINGPGANLLTVKRSTASGTPQFRIFETRGASSNVTISGLTISNGYANVVVTNSGGGGILNGCTLTVAGCAISGNFSDSGGASILNSGGTVNITNSTISGNSALYNGCIQNAFGGTLTITNSTISGNSANLGGGILNDRGATLTVTNSTISGNSARLDGGGIYDESGTVTITNSTLSGNTAGRDGGGLYHVASYAGAGPAIITNATISGNSADRGGGIFRAVNSSEVRVRNTIIAKNTVGSSGPDFSGALISQGFNLIGNNSAATIFPSQSTDQIGTSASPINPMLGVLQDNGGPTWTLPLLPGSTAIDRGYSSGSNSDQRGFPRPSGIAIGGGDGSDIGAFEVQSPGPTALGNISTRMRVETGDNVLIGGFIVTGTRSKKIIVRAIGPSLSLPGKLADPILELHGPGGLIASNDNWMNAANKQEIIDSTVAPSNILESAILTTLPANGTGYTAIVRGVNGGTGVGLIEVYDLDRHVDSKLANISTRGLVQTGDNVMIGGFIVTGAGSQRFIVRALGPSVFANGGLADPTLELFNQDGMPLAANDDWRSTQEAEIIGTTVPPDSDREAAIVITLPPGGTTAIVRGKNGTTGVALVEVFALN